MMKQFKRAKAFLFTFLAALTLLAAAPVYAQCLTPVGQESQTRYDYGTHKMYFCNGTVWVQIPPAAGTSGGVGCVVGQVQIRDGASFDFYNAAGSTNCPAIRQTRTCTMGTMSGSAAYVHPSCITYVPCTLDGQTVPHGGSHTFYSAASHANCASIAQSRFCNNGTLDGAASFNHASCLGTAPCSLDSQVVLHGAAHTFYTTNIHANCASVGQSRTCNNGTLNGSATYNRANCAAPATCTLDGQTVAHGASFTFYSAPAHANCTSVSQSRTCNNGVLDGSNTFQYANCAGTAPCTLDGQTVAHGSARTFFSATVHANCGSVGQSRTCTNGTLDGSGTFQYANCGAPASCTLDGQTVPHGSAHTFYTTNTHANCASVSLSRNCNNGTLDGSASYNRASCVNADTTPNGFTFNDVVGQSVNSLITSNTISITGINTGTSVSVSGSGSPQISIAGGGWTTSGTITDGQSLQVRLTSSGSGNTAHSATVNVGGVTDNWSVTTGSTTTTCNALSNNNSVSGTPIPAGNYSGGWYPDLQDEDLTIGVAQCKALCESVSARCCRYILRGWIEMGEGGIWTECNSYAAGCSFGAPGYNMGWPGNERAATCN